MQMLGVKTQRHLAANSFGGREDRDLAKGSKHIGNAQRLAGPPCGRGILGTGI
jgi:hypothetical protein